MMADNNGNAMGATKNYASHLERISKELNITNDQINDFVNTYMQMGRTNRSELTVSSSVDCEEYCNGSIRDVLMSYKVLHGYIALTICVFGTIANILNVIVLTQKEMSKTPINSMLKWLSVTDMFVMLEYIPFACYMYLILPDKRGFEYSWAVYLLFHMHFTQILHTISILLTVTLALWRYIAIKHPHGTLATCAQTHYSEAILISFFLSPILCFPTYLVFHINETHVWEHDADVVLYHLSANEDTRLYRFNFWVHSIIIKLLPCFALTIISCILIQVLCQAGKRKMKLKSYNSSSLVDKGSSRSSKLDKRTDRTTTLLVAVLILFLITEFPQGILGLLSGILKKCFFKRCYSIFGEIMDLLALINAAIGFLLYGLMSKQFRTTFKTIFITKHKNISIRLENTRNETGVTTACV